MKKIILLLMVILNNHQFLSAQVDTVWTRRFNGSFNSDDIVTDLAVDKIGNVYVTGDVGDTVESNVMKAIVTIKYDAQGLIPWVSKYYSGIYGNCRGNAIAVDTIGNVYITGWIIGLSSTSQFITIKYDSSGNEIWSNMYDNGAGDESKDITLDGYGNVYVTGLSSGESSGYDFATIKYNNSGEQQWVARYTNSVYGYDFPTSIAVDDLGNVYVTGTSYDSTTFYDIVTVKYNSAGIEQWVKRFDDPGLAGSRDDCANAIAIDSQGNVVVTGGVQGTGSVGLPPDIFNDCITIKYNSNGDTLWVRKYNRGFGQDWAEDLTIDDWGNIYIGGSSQGSNSPDYLLIKYNAAGDLVWVRHYNGLIPPSQDYARSVALDRLSNVYITGTSGIEGNYWNFATVKYNPNGEEKWVIRYGEPLYSQWHRAVALGVNEQFNIFVTGKSKGQGTYDDFLTIKYQQEQDIGTILTSNISAGSPIIEVADTSGFSIGDSVVINPGGLTEEINKIISFGSIHLENPLQYNHYAGEQVMKFITTSVDDNETLAPTTFELHQNYPNPFNPSTTISWQSPISGWQTIKLFDVLGREVETIVDGYYDAGSHSTLYIVNSSLSSGVYFYQLKVVDTKTSSGQIFIQTKKMILNK